MPIIFTDTEIIEVPSRHGGARKGAGRPPMGADKKSRRLELRLSEEDHATLLAAADGEPLAPWVLAAAMAAAGR